ncbi:hypothetical protein ATHL_00025 [Anaerolinea thermolimosa]|uniref:hypothetical protein n=1 Tax=Anaerolinea thermolimosa TaxID=229919 RepID=UPI0007814FB3|nr:hypothetical protein [Anaerolinea thermolimosa]GAP05195.1 hypothetical protein ATHL_00025 [Anaerolinea thermolimosa]
MKKMILFALIGAGLYLSGVDFEKILHLNGDTVLIGIAGALALAFLGWGVWTVIYTVVRYPVDRRLEQVTRR